MEYNWTEIQQYYNDNHSLRECIEKYNCNWSTIWKAKKENRLVTRNMKSAQKLRKERGKIYSHSEDTKKKMSVQRKSYLKEHPEMVPYKLNHYSKRTSYAEKYFIEVFEKENILLQHHLQIGLYELDFYNNNLKIYFEVDGDQHYLDKRILESDLKRNQWLFEQGWKGMRLRWSTYQKLSSEQKILIIQNIKNHILNNDLLLPCLQII